MTQVNLLNEFNQQQLRLFTNLQKKVRGLLKSMRLKATRKMQHVTTLPDDLKIRLKSLMTNLIAHSGAAMNHMLGHWKKARQGTLFLLTILLVG